MTAALLLIIGLAVNSTAFTYREGHPSALFPYGRAVSESSVTGLYLNPAYLPGAPDLFLDMAYSRPYGLEGLHAGSVHGGGASRRAGGLLSWSGFGIEEYREETAEAAAGLAPAGWFRAGCGIGLTRLAIATDEAAFRADIWDARFSAVISPFPWLEAGFQQENIRSLFDAAGEDLHFPSWSAGAAIRPVRGFGASWNITRTFFRDINTLAFSANLLECLSVSAGYSRETASIAGAVIIVLNGMMISYGLRYHSYLGATHSFGVSAALGMAPLEEISYAMKTYRPAPPGKARPAVDLKACTADELCAIPGMDRPVAERIVKYRAIMGPLGRKSLIQMGITPGEFRAMEPYLANLAPDDNGAGKFRGRLKKTTGGRGALKKDARPYFSNENRRALFQALVREGVKAGSALRVAEIARDLGKGGLDKKIDGLAFLSDDEKKAAHRACGAR
jgi:hypothetical protein